MRTRLAVLEGSARVFARMPYSAVRIHDLIAEDGVTQGALYHHFPGAKEEVAAALITEMNAMQLEIARGVVLRDGIKAVVSIARHLADALAVNPTMQAGFRLATHTEGMFRDAGTLDDELAAVLGENLSRAVEHGDVRDGVTVADAVEGVGCLFVGVQITSFLRSGWNDIGESMRSLEVFAVRSIATDVYLRSATYLGKPGYPED